MWFHRSVRVDDWLLYSTQPSAGGARGFYTRGSVFARDGRLVASTSQVGMLRMIAHESHHHHFLARGDSLRGGPPDTGAAPAMPACRARMCWIAPGAARKQAAEGRCGILRSSRPAFFHRSRPRQFPHFPGQHEQMAVPPAVLGRADACGTPLPSACRFFEHVNGRLVVSRTTVEMIRSARKSKNAAIDQRQSDLVA